MSHRTYLGVTGLAGLGLLAGFTGPSDRYTAGMTVGNPMIQSAGALALGPSGVLFVGDSKGAAVFAFALGDGAARHEAASVEVANIDAKIAALLGASREDIVINDMATDTVSRTTYLSITRGRNADAQPALIRVTPTGSVQEVRLDSIKFSKLDMEHAPSPDQPFVNPIWAGGKRRTHTVSGLAYTDGELYISGLTNEEFASSFRRAAFPFVRNASVTKVGMYRTSHGAYETEAPIAAFIPITLGGERAILAGYACTPVARFPLRGLTSGAQVRGTTVIEFGSGDSPRDMLAFERGGEEYVLIVTGRRGVARVKAADLAKAAALTSPPAGESAGAPYTFLPLTGVREIERLSKTTFVVLQMSADKTFALHTMDASLF